MTNKEAIEMLRSKMDGKTDTSYEWCECVRIAIKALSEQNSNTGNEGNRVDNIPNDNRFDMIGKYLELLKQGTNIESSYEEMQVIDNILFRFWQMGWLDKIEFADTVVRCKDCKHKGESDDGYPICMLFQKTKVFVELGHYCSRGERKDEK